MRYETKRTTDTVSKIRKLHRDFSSAEEDCSRLEEHLATPNSNIHIRRRR
jgi:hypothetical protein